MGGSLQKDFPAEIPGTNNDKTIRLQFGHIAQIHWLGFEKKMQDKYEAVMRTPLQRALKQAPHDIAGPWPLA